MEQFQQPVLSSKFLNLLANSSTTADSIVFKRAIVSSDKHSISDLKAFDDTYIQTIKRVSESTFSDVQQNDNSLVLVTVFSSNGNPVNYEINTVIYTATYKGQEFLAFSQIANWPIKVPAGNEAEVYNLTLKPKLVISSTSAIATTVSPDSLATNERVDSKDTALQKQLDDAYKDRRSIWDNFSKFITKRGTQTIEAILTFTQKIQGRITLADKADSADKLTKTKKLNGFDFDGSAEEYNIPADLKPNYLWDGADLDNLKVPGLYVGYKVKPKGYNAPINISILIEATDGRYSVKQTKTDFDTKIIGTRFYSNNTWSTWDKLPSESSTNDWSGDNTFQKEIVAKKGLKGNATTSSTADKLKEGDQQVKGSFTLPNDNSMLRVGNDGDIAIVKKQGSQGTFVVGSGRSFIINKSDKLPVNVTDNMNKIFEVTPTGIVMANRFTGSADKLTVQDSSNTDLDKLTTDGIYKVWGVKLTNYRGGWTVYGTVAVTTYGNNIQQIVFENSDNTINVRWFSANKWTDWGIIARDNQATNWKSSQTFQGGLEISHATPFIDFHFKNSTKDFTSRIIEDIEGRLAFRKSDGSVGTILANLQGNADTATTARSPQVIGITPGENLNSIKVPGSYSFQGGSVRNSPVSNWFSLMVLSIGTKNGTQILQDSNSGVVWTRSWNEGDRFTNWNKLSSLSNDNTWTGKQVFDQAIEGNLHGNADTATRTGMIDISNNTNLDDLKDNGNYSCGTNNTYNTPVSKWFTMVVVRNGDFNGTQTLTDTNTGDVWVRTWSSGNKFNNWEKLSKDNSVVHSNGEETIYGNKTFDRVVTFNNGIVNKPISMNGFHMDVSQLVSGIYNVWQNDISGCPGDYGIVEVFENVSNTMYRFTQTNLPEGPHVWVQVKNSFGFSGWKQQS